MKHSIIIIFFLVAFVNIAVAVSPIPEMTKSVTDIGVIEALKSAGIIVQLTMLLLLFMSVVSWAIIISKWSVFKKDEINNRPFEDVFFKVSSFDEVFELSQSRPHSSLARVFRSGYSELKKIAKVKQHINNGESPESLLSGMDNLQRALFKAVNNEISSMEHRLTFLATTGSVSPFIGLFGTVFGIMSSFQQIGSMGSASLAVVAPGISEALIATGFGLFAAIPAAVFYNQFINDIKRVELQLNNFIADFLNISKRNFFQ